MTYLYKSCSDLPISNFDIVYKSNDFRYLVVGYDGYSEVAIPKGANERWEEIKNEWVKLLDDNTVAYFYQLILECVYLETRYQVVEVLLKEIFERDGQMTDETFDTYIEALDQWKYKWNRKNEKLIEIKRLLQQWKQSQNKLNLKMDELEKLKEENEDSDDAISLERQALIIEQSTGIKINIKEDSVKKWIEATKLHSELNEQRRRNNGK